MADEWLGGAVARVGARCGWPGLSLCSQVVCGGNPFHLAQCSTCPPVGSFSDSLAARAETLGPKHPATLTSVYHLADLLPEQGELDEAEQLFRRELAGSEARLGPGHEKFLRRRRLNLFEEPNPRSCWRAGEGKGEGEAERARSG